MLFQVFAKKIKSPAPPSKGPASPFNPSKFINIHVFLKQYQYKINCFVVRI